MIARESIISDEHFAGTPIGIGPQRPMIMAIDGRIGAPRAAFSLPR
jgi:hypothetical protein